MTDTIQQLIDKALIRPDRVRSGKWNPSKFGMCYRQQYWNRKDEPKSNPPDERSIRVMACGQLFHDFVQGLLISDTNKGINHSICNCAKEVKVESEDVLGFADIVMDNEVDDIKSQHSGAFWYMAKKDCDIKKEKYGNWLQVGYYARELCKKFMRLAFISKDDLCIQEYVQPLDEYWLKQIEAELTALRYLWKKGELPPAAPRCEPNKKGEYWECEYCNWKDKCFEIEKGK